MELRDAVQNWCQINKNHNLGELCHDLNLKEIDRCAENVTLMRGNDGALVSVHVEGEIVIDERWQFLQRWRLRNQFLEELGNMYDTPPPLPEPDWEVGDFGAAWSERFFAYHFGKIAEGYGRRDAEEVRSLVEACSPEDVMLLCKFVTKANWRELAG